MTGAFHAILNTFFGLDGLGFGTPDAALAFDRPMPAWAWVAVGLASLALGLWTYRSLPGARGARVFLASLRGVTILLLTLLAAGPMLRLDRILTERDRIYVLVDHSASMAVPDAPGGTTRAAQGDAAIELARPALEALAERSDIAGWRFGSDSREDPRVLWDAESDAETPADTASRLGEAFAGVLDQARGAPIGAIVVLTDGRSTDRLSPAVLRRLESERVPVFAVPLGSPDPVRSVALDRVEHAAIAFAQDTVSVRARVAWSGQPPVGAEVELVDRATGEVLDRATLETADDPESDHAAWVTLVASPPGPGRMDLEARVRATGDDIDPDDNSEGVAIEAIERPLRVLYVDGGPRWEHRYLKNLLLREPSIDASVLLLASGRQYAQEGDTLIPKLPRSPEEWDEYDVVILGDVSGELFGAEQLANLAEHVATRGAGVLWMAGPGATPGTWLETPASPLLPMRAAPGAGRSEPVTASATPEADRLGVLRTDETGRAWDDRLSDPGAGWTRLQWSQAIAPEAIKPGVSVLGTASGVVSGEESPLVMSMRFGSGRSVYVATDEIWRWRYGRGETIPERFWVPLIRMLARGRVESALGAGVLRVRPDQPLPGTPGVIELEVFDQGVIDQMPERVRARVVRADGRREEIELRGEGATRTGEWVPDAPGSFTVELIDGPAELLALSTDARVIEPGDERADLNTDHPFLAGLAERTGGRTVSPGETDRLGEWIPNRSRVHAGTPIIETLWDRWGVLLGLLALLTVEWVGRRLTRLA